MFEECVDRILSRKIKRISEEFDLVFSKAEIFSQIIVGARALPELLDNLLRQLQSSGKIVGLASARPQKPKRLIWKACVTSHRQIVVLAPRHLDLLVLQHRQRAGR